jgi:glucose/arabinose dehydrogenase
MRNGSDGSGARGNVIEVSAMKKYRPSKPPCSRWRILGAFIALAFAVPAHASFHLTQIEQVIGGVNGDTTAQAVQLRMRSAGQNLVAGSELVVFDAAGNNPITLLTFPSNVTNANTGSRILITTPSFASHESSAISSDFTMTAIPASYLAAGRLAFRNGGILWSVSWGGAGYTGPNTGTTDNDADGNFGPPFAGALPSTSTVALLFNGTVSAPSTNNAANYSLTSGAATFTNNAGTSTSLANPSPTPTPSPTPILPRIGKGPIRVELQTIATGIAAPIDLLSANDGSGRLFIVGQTGKISILKNGVVSATPFLDVSGRLVALSPGYDERGLLSLAFHPGFADSTSPGFRKLYTYTSEPVSGAADFTVPISGAPFNHQSVVAEWQVSAGNPDVVDPATRREVMRVDEPQSNHNGATLAFRPSDHYLYLSLGDGGASNDVGPGHNPTTGNAQDLTTVLGKILRIDPLAPALTPSSSDPVSANGKYRVPVSNPFVASAQPANRVIEIFAYGLRNVFRFSFDAATDKLIAGEVGQDHVEEIDLIESGKNYGWNRKEGTFLFNSANGSVSLDPSPDPALTNPIAQYSHDDGIAVLGGFVYRGNTVLALQGKYVFGDLAATGTTSGRLFYLDDLNSGGIKELHIGNNDRALGLLLKSFGLDASGEIYVLADTNIGPTGTTGRVLKVVPVPAAPALLNLSTRLKVQTGNNVLIAGFILTGSVPKKVILRGMGPSLSSGSQPVPGRLSDPTLTLFDGASNPLISNDDWMNSSQKQQIIDSTVAPPDPKESALIATLQPGNYTAILSGVGGEIGVGSVELYDLDQSAPANPVNIATRGFVETADNVMIAGFIIGGSTSQRVLIRAIGPELTGFVPGPLQDPFLELHNSFGTTLATNDSWRSDDETNIAATGIAPTDDREPAILKTLAPGQYTAVVRGSGTSTGVALVEVYQLLP